MTMIEVKPHRDGWKVFESPGVEPAFLTKDQALNYAQNRISFRSGEVRILDPTGDLRDHAAESTARESYISAVTMAGLTFVFPSHLGSAAKEKPTLTSFLTSPFLLRPT